MPGAGKSVRRVTSAERCCRDGRLPGRFICPDTETANIHTMRILLISDCSPFPPTGGDRQRTDLIYRALSQIAATDLYLYRNDARLAPGALQRLQADYRLVGRMTPIARGQRGPWAAIRPAAPKLVDRLAHNLGSLRVALAPVGPARAALAEVVRKARYDLIVSRYLKPAVAMSPWSFLPTIVDIDDFPPQVYRQRLQQEPLNALERAVIVNHLKAYERHLPTALQRARHLWIPNPHDLEDVPHGSVSVLPNIPYAATGETSEPCPPQSGDPVITVIGSLDYQVNIDGIEFFLQRVWPGVRQKRKDAVFRIVGSGLPDALNRRWSAIDGVIVAGFVDRIRDAYDDSSFCVVPLHTGGGTKIKVAEALSHGRTCVVTPHALRGYEHALRHGESLLVADEPADIIAACLELLENTARRDELAARGRTEVERHFSFESFRGIVERSVCTALEPVEEPVS